MTAESGLERVVPTLGKQPPKDQRPVGDKPIGDPKRPMNPQPDDKGK